MDKERIELAFEYRGLERLYQDLVERGLEDDLIARFVNSEIMDLRLGVPLECRENLLQRMKTIRFKLKNVNRVFHV